MWTDKTRKETKMSKVVIDGIKTEKFNQVNGDINYAVNGLNRNDVEKLISNLYEKHASVNVEDNKRVDSKTTVHK